LSNVAGIYVEKSARLYDTGVGNKTKARTAQTSSRNRVQAVSFKSNRLAVLFGSLPENAVIMGGTSRFELQRRLFPLIVKPV
jgi:hypothetical protein